MAEVYPNIVVVGTKDVGAGRTLSVNKDFAKGEEILKVERPIAALDSKIVPHCCANCFLWDAAHYGLVDNPLDLKACLGCKVVKYCSKVRDYYEELSETFSLLSQEYDITKNLI